MNDRKICIIRCVNNETFMQEQDYYINSLIVPEGYDIEVLSVTEASGMCAGYNEAMNASDAKYKIYMHQDVFVIKQDIISKILELFKNPKIGMVGLVGNEKLDSTTIPWNSEKAGSLYMGFGNHTNSVGESFSDGASYKEVEVVDGFFMATQVDIPWREDIFSGFDMYDMSQSLEMKRAGYKVVIPNQKKPWVIHDEDINNLNNYYKSLEVFRNEYEKDFVEPETENPGDIEMLVLIPEGGTSDIVQAAKLTGLKVESCSRVFHPNDEDYTEDLEYLQHYYGHRKIATVFSALFIPAVAKFCELVDIPYISWIYDSPQQAVFYPEIKCKTNNVFVFDKEFKKKIEALGCKNVFYMPCAAFVERVEEVVSQSKKNKYNHDISFVGQLYNYNDVEKFYRLSEDVKKPLEEYNDNNLCDWSKERPWPKMPQSVMALIDKPSPVSDMMGDDYYYGTAVMSRKLAQLERVTILNFLADTNQVSIYTNSDATALVGVNNYGIAEYYNASPLVFNGSKINLNITLPSIETGVPWRVFDIMAAGGFVLTNYQKEIEELFEIDKDIVVFKNLAELRVKVDYYLNHDEERKLIAKNGREKVRNCYSLKNTIMKMYEEIHKSL